MCLFLKQIPLWLPWDDINSYVFEWQNGLTDANSSGSLYFFIFKYILWNHFGNFVNVCIAIIKFGGHNASIFGTIYSNGGHIGLNYTLVAMNWD